jgi:3-(3-hydroxy-phenyl)propionate hydroxylase
VNLQQYYAEEWLVEACAEAGVELRWKHRIAVIRPRRDGAELRVETPSANTTCTRIGWSPATAHAASSARAWACPSGPGLPRPLPDRDVVIKGEVEFPTERWFWFDPPFHPGQSVLLHKQPDDVWRIDFQLGWDADPEAEKQPERVIPRVQAMLGEDVPSTWNGSASTPSAAAGWSASGMAA